MRVVLFFILSTIVSGLTAQTNMLRCDFIAPSISLEQNISEAGAVNIELGPGFLYDSYDKDYHTKLFFKINHLHNLSSIHDTTTHKNFQCVPYLKIQVRGYNFEKRKVDGKRINNNTGLYGAFTTVLYADKDFYFGPAIGFQENTNFFHFCGEIGAGLGIVEGKSKVYVQGGIKLGILLYKNNKKMVQSTRNNGRNVPL